MQLRVKTPQHNPHATRADHALDLVSAQTTKHLWVAWGREEIERHRFARCRQIVTQRRVQGDQNGRIDSGRDRRIVLLCAQQVLRFPPPGVVTRQGQQPGLAPGTVAQMGTRLGIERIDFRLVQQVFQPDFIATHDRGRLLRNPRKTARTHAAESTRDCAMYTAPTVSPNCPATCSADWPSTLVRQKACHVDSCTWPCTLKDAR